MTDTIIRRPYWITDAPQHPNIKCAGCDQPWSHAMWDVLDDANSDGLAAVDIKCTQCGHIIEMRQAANEPHP